MHTDQQAAVLKIWIYLGCFGRSSLQSRALDQDSIRLDAAGSLTVSMGAGHQQAHHAIPFSTPFFKTSCKAVCLTDLEEM